MTAAIDAYVALRRRAGFALTNTDYLLHSFARFGQDRHETHIRTASVIVWASQGPSLAQRHRRYETVRQFAAHVQLEDRRHDVPPPDYFAYRKTRRPPRLYTADEIDQLVAAARRLPPRDGLRPQTYAALISLLTATGVRIAEALALTLEDLTPDGLLIRKTKFEKTRLVPLHDTATAGLDEYLQHRHRRGLGGDRVFVSDRGRPLPYQTVHGVFRRLVQAARLPSGGGRAPTLHGLRHTFAVRALVTSPTGRRQVGQAMRALATYLGHVSIESTYWYLEATPELLTDVAAASEQWVEGGQP